MDLETFYNYTDFKNFYNNFKSFYNNFINNFNIDCYNDFVKNFNNSFCSSSANSKIESKRVEAKRVEAKNFINNFINEFIHSPIHKFKFEIIYGFNNFFTEQWHYVYEESVFGDKIFYCILCRSCFKNSQKFGNHLGTRKHFNNINKLDKLEKELKMIYESHYKKFKTEISELT